MGITSDQAVRWIAEMRSELTRYRRRRKITDDERLNCLSDQYARIYLIHRAISGQVTFVGAPPIDPDNSKGAK